MKFNWIINISVIFLTISCQSNINDTQFVDTDYESDSIGLSVKTIEYEKVDIYQYFYTTDNLSIDKSLFRYKNINKLYDKEILKYRDSLNSTSKMLESQIKCKNYFSDNSFSINFETYIFFAGIQEGDGSLGLVLFNINKNGEIISNLVLTSGGGWENGNEDVNFRFINDSILQTIKETNSRDVDSTAIYIETWSTKIVTNDYKIGTDGYIYILDSDTLTDKHYLRFSKFFGKIWKDKSFIYNHIKYPLVIKKIQNVPSQNETIEYVKNESDLPWDSLLLYNRLFNPLHENTSFRYDIFARDSGKIYYDLPNGNQFGYVFKREKKWELVEVYGLINKE